MTSSYHSGPQSARDHFVEPPSILSRILAGLPSGLAGPMQRLWARRSYNPISTPASKVPRRIRQAQRNWNVRTLLSLPRLLVVVWVLVLFWGERWIFQSSVAACKWQSWERWPRDATPHHLIFLADPQLIDPHTYPGRPWPLSTLTILHTDSYLKRSYIQLQKLLHPDTVFFLGDLFDGGREWKTAHGNTEDPSWANGRRPSGEQAYVETWGKRYGEDFWLKEYDRFGRIFFKYWNIGGDKPGPWQRQRKIISSLPGNHDLGFGAQIKVGVRNRFETYFGEGNRVDVIGNHTFVSVDTVSLSAGSTSHDTADIIKPVEDFLSGIQASKRKAVARELSYQTGNDKLAHYFHKLEKLEAADFSNLPTLDPGAGSADFPTILLTHVPLYRSPGTPCGPNREHWPPATPPKGQTEPVNPDERNAISISGGYQYQNVLSEDDSVRLVSTIGNVVSVFSGDDHDYCEVVHPENKNKAREITVKSMSYAMGVRKPGFLMLSMWNPVGPDGKPLHSVATGHGSNVAGKSMTAESHLCLLPDQLGILIRYGTFLAITFLALTIRAILTQILNITPLYTDSDSESSLLPMSNKDIHGHDDRDLGEVAAAEVYDQHSSNSSTSSTSSNAANLAPRSSAARTRSVSPARGYRLPSSQVRFATPPLVNYAGFHGNRNNEKLDREESFGKGNFGANIKQRNGSFLFRIWQELWRSTWRVAWPVLGVYCYLLWHG